MNQATQKILALTPSQDNMDQSAFSCPGIPRTDNINKLFLDSQPMFLRGDSLVGNEEIGSFPLLLSSVHQSLKAVVEIEPCPTPKFDGEKLSVKKEDKKDPEAK